MDVWVNRSEVAVPEVLHRIRAEYVEMPDLQLTIKQAHRLFGVEPQLCETILDMLVKERFLCMKANSAFVRATD
jgi:hypothetical protein